MTRILIVEDNEMNRDMLERRLIRKGFDVTSVEHGGLALEYLSDATVDLVLMDLRLPVLDGFETTRRIKADDRLKHLPVIALTANATVDDKREAMSAGCVAFETKPVDLDQLLEKISQFT